ncbi:chromodomain-helicase-DNA-binding protein 1-like [Takifugu rubripes]|uniref:chromodomain-helicase-DNA-binding protein 1-like n=1 Tax=Takifugu rubripes TaxID=31033 RepID=UPI001145C6D8|nr:chromodomain-helicase-DNA-binding protein 1-like [Takifugu rubripes]XP_029683669.1 chromodomain-helicase-DNA-binding protein 1-like [Takifugu rubripes]
MFNQSALERWGLRGIQLKSYQLDGVQWLSKCFQKQRGCILADEMGLGKTCQAISLLLYVSGALRNKGPFLVLSPLSVLENWRKEFKFAPSLKVLCYKGDKARRAELQTEMDSQGFDVLLTTYELCLKDASFLRRFTWAVLVVDEAHRLKNQFSKLHQSLKAFSVKFRLLLTGTPIQNNLQELYSLLNFIQPTTFKADNIDNFITSYCNLQHQPALAAELQERLEPFLLRRVKGEVDVEVPNKMELVIYHGMTALQKKYYKAVLMKDLEAFQNDHGHKNRLLNILINLRKCVNHPYLFDGVEPEPFEMGEHLIEASGKLSLLNNILSVLHKKGHRVLLFSQMTRMLDIVEDYMEYKDYSYERLDGSIRGEDRDQAVKNFSNNDIFAFLLSTKAGGVGLNLTAADTVIFIDSDFNPHNDLQAAARCHRIGQNRPVKIIHLIGRDTVEEIMYCRAVSKLNLTKTVIEDGRFSLLEQAESASAGLQLSEILTFGLDKLLSSEESSVQELNLEKILGPSRDGQWVNEDLTRRLSSSSEEEECSSSGQNHLYYFEGKDYSKVPSAADKVLFQMVMKEWMAEFLESKGSRTLRQRTVNPKKRKYVESQERDEPTAKRRNVQKKINNKKRSYEQASLGPFSFQAKKTKVERIQMRPCSVRLMRLPAHLKCHY